LWNDPRSAGAAAELIAEFGAGETGRQEWIRAVGLVPQPVHTVTKLRWLAEHETTNAARAAAVCLPHDWLTGRLLDFGGIDKLVTDRSDASGTGYWSPLSGEYRMDLLRSALGHDAVLPRVLNPSEPAGDTVAGAVVGPGAGDNAAVALGVGHVTANNDVRRRLGDQPIDLLHHSHSLQFTFPFCPKRPRIAVAYQQEPIERGRHSHLGDHSPAAVFRGFISNMQVHLVNFANRPTTRQRSTVVMPISDYPDRLVHDVIGRSQQIESLVVVLLGHHLLQGQKVWLKSLQSSPEDVAPAFPFTVVRVR
jgi:hypothetical protein